LTPASTRRDRNAEATRQVIMQAGRELFATQPYPEITGLQICVRAGVTRGALQHHFGSKLGLFMAIFDGLQSDGVSRVADALADHDDPWEQARAAIVVIPSRDPEPGGRMALEAMANGAAVIFSPGGALAEIGGDAVIYADADGLAEAIRSLGADPKRLAALAEAGRQRAARAQGCLALGARFARGQDLRQIAVVPECGVHSFTCLTTSITLPSR